MKSSSYFRIKESRCEIFSFNNVCILKQFDTGKVYQTTNKELVALAQTKGTPEKEAIGDRSWWAYVIVLSVSVFSACLLTMYIAFTYKIYITWNILWKVGAYSLSQMFLHEGAHYLALRLFGRKPDCAGIKINYYIFPAFYIRMNDVNLLHKRQKFTIHSSGVLANCITNNIVLAYAMHQQSWNLIVVACWFGIGILWNAIPLLDSDGYKALLAILSEQQTKDRRNNCQIIKAINTINTIVVIIYIIYYLILLARMM